MVTTRAPLAINAFLVAGIDVETNAPTETTAVGGFEKITGTFGSASTRSPCDARAMEPATGRAPRAMVVVNFSVAWRAGERALAADLSRKAIGELEGCDYVVIPSGSCADQIRNVYPQLLADDPAWGLRARTLADRAYELTSFLVDVLKLSAVPNQFDGSVTYHDSCKGLRGLAIKRQ